MEKRFGELWILQMAVAEGFEPSHGRINSAVPYQLGYATRDSAVGFLERLQNHWTLFIGHFSFVIFGSAALELLPACFNHK